METTNTANKVVNLNSYRDQWVEIYRYVDATTSASMKVYICHRTSEVQFVQTGVDGKPSVVKLSTIKSVGLMMALADAFDIKK